MVLWRDYELGILLDHLIETLEMMLEEQWDVRKDSSSMEWMSGPE